MAVAIAEKPRRRLEWWIYAALVLALVQVASFLVPQMRRGGPLAIICWLFGMGLWPYAAALLLLISAFWSLWRRPFWSRSHRFGFLILLTTILSTFAFRIYPSPHDGSPSNVAFRLPLDGPVTVGWGGGEPSVNYHVSVPAQRWAYDLLVTRQGKTHRDEGKILADYYCYDMPVLAPATGTVRTVAAKDDDQQPGTIKRFRHPGGNHVVIEVAPREYLFVCHMKPGSVKVKPGDAVTSGQEIGRAGNSGNTSEPHVHVHLQDTPDIMIGEGIPLEFSHYKADGKHVERGIPHGGIEGEQLLGEVVENESQPAEAAPRHDNAP